MHIVDMHGSSLSQLPVGFAPRAARLVGGKRFTRVFRHGINIRIERQRFFQHQRSVGVVRTQDDGRFVGTTRSLQSVFDAGNDGFLHPRHVVLNRCHGLAETNQEAHFRVFLYEGSDGLTGIVADQRRDGTVAVLRLQSIMVGKGFRQDDIIEHLDDADAATVSLINEEREHILILLHGGIVNLWCERIVVQFHQRGKGMTVPQVHRIHIIGGQHVEIFNPKGFVVEPREVLGRIRIFVDPMPRQINRLLQSHTGTAKHHLGSFGDGGKTFVGTVHQIVFLQTVHAIDNARTVITRNGNLLALLFYSKALSRRATGNPQGDSMPLFERFQQRGCIFCLRSNAPLLYLNLGRDREATG